jgi:hypothetical protein
MGTRVNLLPDAGYLNECFFYEPSSGELIWKQRPTSHFGDDPESKYHKNWNGRFAGTKAGSPRPSGHLYVSVASVSYAVHKIIWKMVTGQDVPELDHRNTNPSDNRWDNLRPATRRQNTYNKKCYKNSRTGFKGVRPSARNPARFSASIKYLGRRIRLGTYDTAEAAHAARCAKARELHGEFWNPG